VARLDLETGFMTDALLVDSDVDRRGALARGSGRGQRSKLSSAHGATDPQTHVDQSPGGRVEGG
jgi:hypothetical protein